MIDGVIYWVLVTDGEGSAIWQMLLQTAMRLGECQVLYWQFVGYYHLTRVQDKKPMLNELGSVEGNSNGKGTPFAGCTYHADGSIVLIDNFFGNR
jgi:hypothetical protein